MKNVKEIQFLPSAVSYPVHPWRRAHKWVFLLLLVMNPFFKGRAQLNLDYSIHANIIYHFTKYIEWPVDKKTGNFVIGIIGESPLYDALTDLMVNKNAGTQKIVVKRFPLSAKTFDCQILYISEEESWRLKKIAASTTGLPVLIVTESIGLASKGACINFIVVDDRLKLEINKTIIDNRNLNIASELLNLGIPVK